MKKPLVTITSILIIAVLCLIALCACGSPQDALAGRWTKTDGGIMFSNVEFFKDGTYSSDHANYDGAYSVEGERIKFTGVLVDPVTLSYKIDGDNLFFYYKSTSEKPAATFERVK